MNSRVDCTRFSTAIRSLLLLLAAGTLSTGLLRAQDPPPRTDNVPVVPLTMEDIRKQRDEVEGSELTDAEKERANGYLNSAEAQLKAAQTATDAAKKHELERLAAPQRVEELKAELAEYQKEWTPPKVTGTAIEIEQELSLLNQKLKDAEAAKAKWSTEAATRTKRRDEIEKALAGMRTELPKVEMDLTATENGEAPVVFRSWRLDRRARRRVILEQQKSYEAELARYAETIEKMRLEAEAAPLRVDQLKREVDLYSQALEKQKATERADREREARNAVRTVHESAVELAEKNAELARRVTQRTEEIDAEIKKAEAEVADMEARTKKLADRHTSIERKLEAPGMAAALGPDLMRERLSLPHAGDQRHEIRRRNATIGRIIKSTSADDRERNQLQHDLDGMVDTFVATHDVPPADVDRVREEVRTLYETRLADLSKLLDASGRQLQVLERLNFAQVDLVAQTEDYGRFLAERSRWVRSASPLAPADVARTWEGLLWMVDSDKWLQVADDLRSAMEDRPFLTVLVLMAVVLLAGLRERLRRKIGALGAVAGKSYTADYSLTTQTLAYTIAVAAVWPLLVVFVGWQLWAAVESDDFSRAVGVGLVTTGVVFATLEFTRQLFRHAGLADAHFHWKRERIRRARSHLQWLALFGLPSMFIVGLVEWDRDITRWSTLGRMALIVEYVLFALFAWLVFRPVVVKRNGEVVSSGTRTERILHATVTGLPILFAVLTAAGYQYTTWRLGLQMLRTVWLILAVSVGQGMIVRWLYYSRGRLALEQIRKRKEAEAAAQPESTASPAAATDGTTTNTTNTAIVAPPEPEIDLATVNAHTRQLLKTCVALTILVGFWFIWYDEVPAFGGLDTPVWSNAVQITRLIGEEGAETAVTTTELRPIRVSDVLFAIVVLVVTLSIARNVPSLLEVLVLQYLPMDAGGRYAASMLSQYTFVIIGVVASFGLLGVSYATLSWLTGALLIGLGFGLQEVFANFVCGLILLFERPIRVGDIVTVGETTGIATRIQIRATTIRDWDRKEYIVPNKELVTGRLLNWTLSDKINRVVITIGVAYGSDTTRARALLFDILHTDPEIMDDPAPLVTFEGFGDSTLNMVVRAYLPTLDNRLETVHRLHTTIHERFADEGLEIAFPQRDIHVRSLSIPEELVRGSDSPRSAAAPRVAEQSDEDEHGDRSDVA